MPSVIDSLALAWLSVTRHRVGSLLAMAGVAVGVCALTSIMSVEQAWRRAVTEFFAPMDLETVQVAVPSGPDWRNAGFRRWALEQSDVEAIAQQCPSVLSVTRMTRGTRRVEADDGTALDLAVRAVEAQFTSTLPDEVKEGRLFTPDEVARRAPVCVLSTEARLWLFGVAPVAGRHVRLHGHRFEVIGVIAGNRRPPWMIGSRTVYIPETWARAVLRVDPQRWEATDCFVRAKQTKEAVNQIERLLRRRIGGDGSRPFTRSLWQVREVALHARSRATIYAGLAGLCALLAAGLGIAALLFVSVTERSREIGIHRALGASRLRVCGEYLLAAVMLSAGGALLGALAGIPAAAAGAFSTRWQPVLDPLADAMLTAGGREFPKLAEIAPSVSWEAVAVAMVLALLTGAFAALAPASDAARINPAMAIAQRAGMPRRTRHVLTCLQVAFGVVVLVVLTSYYALLESEEKAEARRVLGQDTVSAAVDPIAALREPVDQRYIDECRYAFAHAFSAPDALASLRSRTPLLTGVLPYVALVLSLAHGGRIEPFGHVKFTTAEAFAEKPELDGEAREHVDKAFRAQEPVVVINPDVKESLFGGHDPIGQSLSVAGRRFTVIAVRPDPPGYSGVKQVFVPIGYYPGLRPRAERDGGAWLFGEVRVEGQPIDPRGYTEAAAQLREALLPMLPEDYRKGIKFSAEIPETTKQFILQHKAIAVRGAVGALAVLLVALIGLVNMLLVSVHEEMTETGVRRALGAQRADVLLHFLSRGVLLSALGAGAGLGVAALICWATRNWAGLPISVSVFWAGLGALATVIAGTVVSLIPAFAAARVHPVEALRYE